MPQLTQYDYIFGIGTVFAMLDAFNNGANDVANSWATSVSSRSISYRWAMVLATVCEMAGAIATGARTASTIKDGIIPLDAFQGNAGVQLLAFACAIAAASSWVMWCTIHSTHVSSSYSIISAVAGVGVATVGASHVQWGWNEGKGLGAIFAGLGLAPLISAGFASTIFLLIKFVVHMRASPVQWSVYTSPFWFLLAACICTLSIVYKGSPQFKLSDRPGWWVGSVVAGTGAGVCLLSIIFFVPYLYCLIIRKDQSLRWYHMIQGPALLRRPIPAEAEKANVRNYAVVQEDDLSIAPVDSEERDEKKVLDVEANKDQRVTELEPTQETYRKLMDQGRQRMHEKMIQKGGPLGWAMRTLRDNPMGAGSIYELHNIRRFFVRLPAMVVVGALYGVNYDIHASQTGVLGTPEGARMARVYSHAEKYSNEVEHSYAFIQVLTACTASFAHGANDIGNSVGPWAAMYAAWSTGKANEAKAPVPIWQLAVLALCLSIGFVTYGYNIMKVMGNKITYHSPSRGCSMEMGAAITVLLASQQHLPVSTSMCITGATVGVGLCNGTIKAVNWQRVGLLMFGWIMTIPIAGTLAGCLMGLILNAPHF
ncbi:putative sodium/phosphate symporter [Stachybotrys elegans]|uniref:Phosphate transporter n=1 Tax=Stachybotrys elegans TaxID=80388 RepID=A0A8K0SJE5_9HYPO|nr:putative sodium/phosphate symporter [Stachybotrys elegans]